MRLRTALRINSLFSVFSGLMTVALAGPISDLFDVNSGWILGVGAGLIPFGLVIGALARRGTIGRTVVLLIVAADLVWVAAAGALIAITGVIAPGGKGVLAVLTTFVAVLAWTQWSALDEATGVRS